MTIYRISIIIVSELFTNLVFQRVTEYAVQARYKPSVFSCLKAEL